MLSDRILTALVTAAFPARYYEMCRAHPLQNLPACKCPTSEVVAALEGLGTVKKLPGPGRVYSVTPPGLSAEIEFSFIVQSAGKMVEPCLSFAGEGSNFAVLAYEATISEGKAPSNPPYPRPSFFTPAELRQVVAASIQLALVVGETFAAQPGGAGDLAHKAAPGP